MTQDTLTYLMTYRWRIDQNVLQSKRHNILDIPRHHFLEMARHNILVGSHDQTE